jgi:hypothetical protein
MVAMPSSRRGRRSRGSRRARAPPARRRRARPQGRPGARRAARGRRATRSRPRDGRRAVHRRPRGPSRPCSRSGPGCRRDGRARPTRADRGGNRPTSTRRAASSSRPREGRRRASPGTPRTAADSRSSRRSRRTTRCRSCGGFELGGRDRQVGPPSATPAGWPGRRRESTSCSWAWLREGATGPEEPPCGRHVQFRRVQAPPSGYGPARGCARRTRAVRPLGGMPHAVRGATLPPVNATIAARAHRSLRPQASWPPPVGDARPGHPRGPAARHRGPSARVRRVALDTRPGRPRASR